MNWPKVHEGERYIIREGWHVGESGTVVEERVSAFGHRCAVLDLDGGGRETVRTKLLTPLEAET